MTMLLLDNTVLSNFALVDRMELSEIDDESIRLAWYLLWYDSEMEPELPDGRS